jgi:hypothetical protein
MLVTLLHHLSLSLESFSRTLMLQELKDVKGLTNHDRFFGHYGEFREGPCTAGDPVILLFPHDEISGPVPVPADRSVGLDESAALAVNRLPSGREPSAPRTIGPKAITLQ